MQLSASSRIHVSRRESVSRQRQCACMASLSRPRTATTTSERGNQEASRLIAALSATILVSSAFSPAAWAEVECFGPFCGEAGNTAEVTAEPFAGINDGQKQKLSAADEAFQKSDTLKALLEKSEANKAKNKRDIQNKYCYRQAELGIGDCGGLRLIPGMTKSGKQRTPEWLQKVLGVEVPKVEGEGKTLADLLGPDAGQ